MEKEILPFFMTYSYPFSDRRTKYPVYDLEYLEELFPVEAKKILGKVMNYVNSVDCEGSFLYDEFPERLSIYRLAESIFAGMKMDAEAGGKTLSREETVWLRNMIKLVLYHEILKRRMERDYLFEKNSFINQESLEGFLRF